MSPFFIRLLATASACALAAWLALPASTALAGPPPDNAWVTLAPLPEELLSPVFAVAVNPQDGLQVLVGTGAGSIYRSVDGGASWRQVARAAGRGVLTIAFNPFKPGQVLAGTSGDGVWQSSDAGATWARQPGPPDTDARAFAFAKNVTVAGTNHGILASSANGPWVARGLGPVAVSALAAAAVNDPPRLVAGGDSSAGDETLPLFQSGDAGVTWTPLKGPLSASNMVAALSAGPLPPKGDTRPLLLGTNAGAYLSNDNGVNWAALPGLPATDYNLVLFQRDHPDRFYLASDGGASQRGGLWSTGDGGRSFRSLNPPLAAITALAASPEESPMLYVAGFRGVDHRVVLWGLRDAGGAPVPPVGGLPSPAVAAAHAVAPHAAQPAWRTLATGPEAPYLAIGLGAFSVLLLALVAYLRRGRE